ncbi:MAG TPA: LacI family transcriptional regulator [Peptococcaceae bacterium]|nr:LacI family transcriptional regulator [Peptococcaceae bacterium]
MVTIRDVARHAQVSISTVSRVLNETDHAVSPETRKKVLQAIEELGFIPNAMARGLHHNKTKTIGLIIQDISNPYYPSIVRGVEDEAQELGYTVILANVYRSKERTAKYLNVFREKRVDGIIFTGGGVVKDAVEEKFFEQTSISTVVIGKPCNVKLPSIQINNVQSSREACEYLLKLGHRQIVTITGPAESTTTIDRLEGYQQALKRHGIEPEKRLIIQGNFEYNSGYKAVQEFPEIGRGKVTALFAQNDMMAIGAMKALQEKGLRVPEDIAIIGFDNIPLSSFVTPALSTVDVPVYEMGKTAMRMLADILNGHEVSRLVTLPTRLAIRQSC